MTKRTQKLNRLFCDSLKFVIGSIVCCRRRTPLVLLLLTALVIGNFCAADTQAAANDEKAAEYKLKAAFIYNFTKFITWPPKAFNQQNDESAPIIITIMGDCPFEFFQPIADKQVRNRPIVVRQIKGPGQLKISGDENIEEYLRMQKSLLTNSHVLYLAQSERQCVKQILEMVSQQPTLTVSGMEQFVEMGGMIDFVKVRKKVRFKVNLSTAKKTKLKISSKLLSLAVKVINDPS